MCCINTNNARFFIRGRTISTSSYFYFIISRRRRRRRHCNQWLAFVWWLVRWHNIIQRVSMYLHSNMWPMRPGIARYAIVDAAEIYKYTQTKWQNIISKHHDSSCKISYEINSYLSPFVVVIFSKLGTVYLRLLFTLRKCMILFKKQWLCSVLGAR